MPTLSNARHQKTHLDALPPELILEILRALRLSDSESFSSNVNYFQTAWPGSRYSLLSEPLLEQHETYKFDGRRSCLAAILAKIVARPESRFWARVLHIPDPDEYYCRDEFAWTGYGGMPWRTFDKDVELKEEPQSIKQALRQLLPTAEVEVLTARAFLTPTSRSQRLEAGDRLRVLICVFPNLTGLNINRDFSGWDRGTTASMTRFSPGPDPPLLVPVPVPVLRRIETVSIQQLWRHGDHEWPRKLLWAFFLPKVRMVIGTCVHSNPALVGEPAWAMKHGPSPSPSPLKMNGASGVQVLHLLESALGEAELLGLLRLPSALREFCYSYDASRYEEEDGVVFSVDALKGALTAQAESLEKVVVKGLHYGLQGAKRRQRLGSLLGFPKLRELQVDFWMLVGPDCSKLGKETWQRAKDLKVGLSGLPRGLVKLALRVNLCRRCKLKVCHHVEGHLTRLFECMGEWAPGLERLELIFSARYWVQLTAEVEPVLQRMERELRKIARDKGAKVEVCVSKSDGLED